MLRIPPASAANEVVLRLSGEADAVPLARRAVQELGSELEHELLENLGLLVSELVTNSLRHADTPASASIELRAMVSLERVRVEVADRGPGFDPRLANDRAGSGWGLYLVDQLADRWGVSRTDGTTVWFEIDLG